MKIEIKSRLNDRVLFTHEADGNTLRLTAEVAVKARANLSNAYLRGAYLTDAYLRGANLTDANLTDADLPGADLTGADLRGADLTIANLSVADLTRANLTDANLSSAYLTGAYLRGADLRGAYLCGAYLRGADLRGADLRGADLTRANLTDANLSSANLTDLDVPVIPNLDAQILAAIEAGGKLDMRNWHTCETTHCRAGWAITLAGEAGAALEARFGPAAAGALIYDKSCPDRRVPDFLASDAEAMADMRARAGITT